MSACVTDANIWIDLYAGALLNLAPHLGIAYVVPVPIAAELDVMNAPSRERLEALGVEFRSVPDEQIYEAMDLAEEYPNPSAADLIALVVARALSVTLLTGDSGLRSAAEQEGVTVHGTIWLMRRMVSRRLITQTAAQQAHRAMLDAGRRLPRF